MASLFEEESETLDIILDKAENDPDWYVRCVAVENLSGILKDESKKKEFLRNCILSDPFVRDDSFEEDNPRKTALAALLDIYPGSSLVIELLQNRAASDSDNELRKWAQQMLQELEQQSTETAQ